MTTRCDARATSPTILVVCPWPYPPTNGTRVHIWGLIRFFQELRWHVVLAIGVWPQKAAKVASLSDGALPGNIEAHVFSRAPRWSGSEDQEAVALVQRLIDSHSPRVVWCHYADVAPLAAGLRLRGAKLWFRTHNFELGQHLEKMREQRRQRLRGRRATLAGDVRWAASLLQTSVRIFQTERRMHRIADRIFFNSHGDMRAMSRLYKAGRRGRDWVVPFVDCDPVAVSPGKDPLDVAYLGSGYGSTMQLSGVQRLLEDIVPAIQAAMPGRFRFHIIGTGGRARLKDYVSPTVVVHDFVPDPPALLHRMDIACLPVQLGWGCKIKVLQTMGSGIPTVGAPEAFRGLPPCSGGYFSCRSPREFVHTFERLLDPHVRQRTAETARAAYSRWVGHGRRLLAAALEAECER